MPLLQRKRVLLAKTEATYGTDPTPTGAANAILVTNMKIEPIVGGQVTRDLVRPFLGASENLQGERYVQITFDVEIQGSGAAGTEPGFGPLLKACGLGVTTVAATSNTYAPVSSAFSSVTLYYNVDGVLHKITGARGNVKFNFAVGKIPLMSFTFKGLYNAPTDTAAPSPTYTSFKTPFVATTANTTSFSIFGFSGNLQMIDFDFGNTVDYMAMIGTEYVQLAGRNITGTAVIEAPTITAKDFFGAAAGSTLGTLALTHGTAAGSRAVVASSTLDVLNPTYAEDNGVVMLSIPFVLVPSTAGNDEISIAFT